MSRPNPVCLFFEVASRLISSGVPSHDFCHNFCSACAVTVVIFRHLRCSFYLLTYRTSYAVRSAITATAEFLVMCCYQLDELDEKLPQCIPPVTPPPVCLTSLRPKPSTRGRKDSTHPASHKQLSSHQPQQPTVWTFNCCCVFYSFRNILFQTIGLKQGLK